MRTGHLILCASAALALLHCSGRSQESSSRDATAPKGGSTVGTGGSNVGAGGSGASGSGSDSGGSGGSAGSDEEPTQRDVCVPFGLELVYTCAACPSEHLTCPCGLELTVDRCNYGQCLAALDCDVACRNFRNEHFIDDLRVILSCVTNPWCSDDALCGTGRCLGESDLHTSRCVDGSLGTTCLEDGDCTSERCVAGICTDGLPGALCTKPSDCGSGTCANVGGEEGVCTSGAPGEACVEDAHCAPGSHCVEAICYSGESDDPCNEHGDCQSGHCLLDEVEAPELGICTDRQPYARCYVDLDCESELCARQEGASRGFCTTGEPGAPCYADDDCLNGSCLPAGSDTICATE